LFQVGIFYVGSTITNLNFHDNRLVDTETTTYGRLKCLDIYLLVRGESIHLVHSKQHIVIHLH